MKAEDLMVGDWVTFNDCELNEIVPIKIAALGTSELYAHIDNDEVCDVIGYHELTGIPLTSEILERNGFKNVSVITVGTPKMRWVSEDTRTEITIWMDYTLPMEIVKNVYYEDEVSYTLPFPGTVHQLQHALRLCGIDQEIVL